MHSVKIKPTAFSKVFIQFFLSAIAVMIIPTATAIFLAANLLHVADMEFKKDTQQRIQKMKTITEDIFSDAINLTYRNSSNTKILRYASANRRNYWTEYEISNTLQNSLIGYDTVHSNYLFLPQFEYVIADGTSNSSDIFFQQRYSMTNIDWIDKYVRDASFVSVHPIQTTEQNQNCWIVIRTVSSNNQSDVPAVLVCEIPATALLPNLKEIRRNPDDLFIIYNDNGIMLSTYPSTTVNHLINMTGTSKSSEYTEMTSDINGNEYHMMHFYHTAFDLNYIYGTSSNLSASTQIFSLQYIGIILVFCIAITLLFCLIFARKNYAPIKNILRIAFKDKNALRSVQGNEYKQIENILRNFMKRNLKLTEAANKHANEFQEFFLEKLLRGKIQNQESLSDSYQLYNISFHLPYFQLIAFEPDDTTILFNDETLSEEERLSFTRFILENITSELFFPIGKNYLIQIEYAFIIIINYEKNNIMISEKISKITNEIRSFVLHHFNLQFSSYISEISENPENLPGLYSQILTQMEEKAKSENLDKNGQTQPDCIHNCISIIKNEYSDNTLSVTNIAEKLKMNPSYLSRYFKQQTGIGILDYIHRYRISIAKKILKENPETLVKELTVKTGFYNDTAFIRVFKKIEGITPGQYRGNI